MDAVFGEGLFFINTVATLYSLSLLQTNDKNSSRMIQKLHRSSKLPHMTVNMYEAR